MRIKLYCYFVWLCIPKALYSVEVEFSAQAVERAIQTCIIAEQQTNVVNLYQKRMNQTTGAISSETIADICSNFLNSECSCKNFTDSLFGSNSNENLQFKEVCKNSASISKEICVNDFFVDNTLAKNVVGSIDVNVNRIQGELLAKEYALIQNKQEIECFSGNLFNNHDYPLHIDSLGVYHSNSVDKLPTIDDYLLCANKDYKYEFRFDDLNETVEKDRELSIKKAICRIHNVSYLISGNDVVCNTSDKILCDKLNDSFAKFGYSSIIENNVCSIKSGIKTAFGINNYALYNNSFYERLWNPGIKDDIWTTVVDAIGVENLKSFSCEDKLKSLKHLDANYQLKTDYYLRCKINGEIIDFMFLNNFQFLSEKIVSAPAYNAFKAGVGFACYIEGDPIESNNKAHYTEGDAGGWTLCGLAQNSHPKLNIKSMTIKDVVNYHYKERFVGWGLYKLPIWISPVLLELSFGGLGTFHNQLNYVLFGKNVSTKISDNTVSEIKKYEKLGTQSDLYEALVKKRYNSYGDVSGYIRRSCRRMVMEDYFFSLANLFKDVMYKYEYPVKQDYVNRTKECESVTSKSVFNQKFGK